jgi:hypothetical protein
MEMAMEGVDVVEVEVVEVEGAMDALGPPPDMDMPPLTRERSCTSTKLEEMRAVNRESTMRLEREARKAGEDREGLTHEAAAVSHVGSPVRGAPDASRSRRAHSLGVAEGLDVEAVQLPLGQGGESARGGEDVLLRKRSAGQVRANE